MHSDLPHAITWLLLIQLLFNCTQMHYLHMQIACYSYNWVNPHSWSSYIYHKLFTLTTSYWLMYWTYANNYVRALDDCYSTNFLKPVKQYVHDCKRFKSPVLLWGLHTTSDGLPHIQCSIRWTSSNVLTIRTTNNKQ